MGQQRGLQQLLNPPLNILQLLSLLDYGQVCVVMGKEHQFLLQDSHMIKVGDNERLTQTSVHPPGFQLMFQLYIYCPLLTSL